MKIYIMRHGDAVLRANNDMERVLTKKGKNDAILVIKKLQQQISTVEKILVSPYLRAQQTLQVILENLYIPAKVEVMDILTPTGNAKSAANHILNLTIMGTNSVLIISHLPLIHYLFLTLCPDETPLIFHTSSIACIQLYTHHHKACFNWILHPF
ncbi:Phosphohistidine phosphatase SixA [Candidatus Hartigia pinicola]|nr:Phosphohistidine phosphatase SixA [Candidatus Hartigia pinicola]